MFSEMVDFMRHFVESWWDKPDQASHPNSDDCRAGTGVSPADVGAAGMVSQSDDVDGPVSELSSESQESTTNANLPASCGCFVTE